jgi:hypothetical protein
MDQKLVRLFLFVFTVALLIAPISVMAQSDRGAINGTVTDSTGAVVPAANVVATRTETGGTFQTVSTATGNYTLDSLPVGTYTVAVEGKGFQKYIQTGIHVQTAQTARVDVALQVGSASESVTVNADAPLLKTESAEQSSVVSGDEINNLPLTYAGAGLRNPTAFTNLQAGANVTYDAGSNFEVKVNGIPNGQFRVLMDGQDITSGIDPTHLSESHPSSEALQEFTLQTSNFAAEFGQVAGGLFNFTSRSGSNQLHGSAYDYFVNEAFNAGEPYTNNGTGGLVRPKDRNNDYGFSIGGPVWIPKVYNGKDKTFFFFNLEQYRVTQGYSGVTGTVPTAAYRTGDFSAALTGTVLGTDALGRPILENQIYDPGTTRTVNGQVIRDPFPGNIIPTSRIDPVAAKIQALIPNPTNSGVVNNFAETDTLPTVNSIPSIKIDQYLGTKTKIAFYWSDWENDVSKNFGDGLPTPISSARYYKTRTNSYRATVDETITPTLLLHFGVGEERYIHTDSAPPATLGYNAVSSLGLVGGSRAGFPQINITTNADGGGFNPSFTGPGSTGATATLGPTNAGTYYNDAPTVTIGLTWVRGSHTFKTGVEARKSIWSDVNWGGTMGVYNFNNSETGLPYLQSLTLNGGSVGFSYASFLLGAVNSASVSSGQDPQMRKMGYGTFIQDTWKITRKLTLDYGLRWDYQTEWHEMDNRFSEFGPTTANPSAGGLPGAVIYEGSGAGRCNCSFTHAYPFALAPRLGAAYQIDSKTVLRGGWGFIYGPTPGIQYMTGSAMLGTGWNTLSFSTANFGVATSQLSQGLQYSPSTLYNASLNPGIRPDPGQIDPPSYYLDPNAGRPPRINQWNISLQRQITRDFMLQVAYVGNRGAWMQADNMEDINGLSNQILQKNGLNLNNAADRALLVLPMNSPQVIAAGFKVPYASFPATLTLAQALRPYPQFSSITSKWDPVGNTWYDGLQTTATKRFSHGLTGTMAFTYDKELSLGAMDAVGWNPVSVNDVYNRGINKGVSAESQPVQFTTGFSYSTPPITTSKIARTVTRDWTIGGYIRDSSGLPILSPSSNNNLNTLLLRAAGGTYYNRVPGVPLYLQNLNCHCIDPNKDLVLNPAAWTDAGPGQFGGQPYWNDYRYQRRPSESLSLGRIFRIRESKYLEVRMEAFNVLNHTNMNNPSSSNPSLTPTYNNGVLTSGFGYINPGSLYSPPRQGQLLMRLRF